MSRQSISQRIWIGLLISGIILLLLTEILPWGHQVDMLFSNAIYNHEEGRFLLLHSGLTEKILHDFVQQALRLVMVYALIQVIYGAYLHFKNNLSIVQREVWLRWVVLLLAGILVSVLVSGVKQITNTACPWSLSDFGGEWPYTSLFDTKPWGAGRMACWPGGHAAGGFGLLAVTFVGGWPPSMWSKKLKNGNVMMPNYLNARSFIIYTLLLGNFMGITRVLQGGHFISHQLWSLWWVVFFMMILVEVRLVKKRWVESI